MAATTAATTTNGLVQAGHVIVLPAAVDGRLRDRWQWGQTVCMGCAPWLFTKPLDFIATDTESKAPLAMPSVRRKLNVEVFNICNWPLKDECVDHAKSWVDAVGTANLNRRPSIDSKRNVGIFVAVVVYSIASVATVEPVVIQDAILRKVANSYVNVQFRIARDSPGLPRRSYANAACGDSRTNDGYAHVAIKHWLVHWSRRRPVVLLEFREQRDCEQQHQNNANKASDNGDLLLPRSDGLHGGGHD